MKISEIAEDFNEFFKHDMQKEIEWIEEEFNENFLSKNDYNDFDIRYAKSLISILLNIKEQCVDKQIYYIVDSLINRLKKIYPEFFESDLNG